MNAAQTALIKKYRAILNNITLLMAAAKRTQKIVDCYANLIIHKQDIKLLKYSIAQADAEIIEAKKAVAAVHAKYSRTTPEQLAREAELKSRMRPGPVLEAGVDTSKEAFTKISKVAKQLGYDPQTIVRHAAREMVRSATIAGSVSRG